MLDELKEAVWRANLDLVRFGLVTLTFGNASGLDRKKGVMAIKPSGISYDKLKPADIVLVDLAGRRVEGRLSPSSDTPTHLELYRVFSEVGGIAHAHSIYATVYAQARREIPVLERPMPMYSMVRSRSPVSSSPRKPPGITSSTQGRSSGNVSDGYLPLTAREYLLPATALSPGVGRPRKRSRTACPSSKSPRWRSGRRFSTLRARGSWKPS